MLRDAIRIPERVTQSDWVVSLDAAIHDRRKTLDDYVVTPQLAGAFDRALGLVAQAVRTRRSQAAFLHGSFGSGKSHFMAVLHQLLAHDPDARAIPELGEVVTRHDDVLAGARVLELNYHLIGADTLESAILGGYVRQVRERYPEAPLPAVHQTDGLLANADEQRALLGDEAFFAALNRGTGAVSPGMGGLAKAAGAVARWDPASYDAARAQPVGEARRTRLVSDLVATMFSAFTGSTDYVDLDVGLAAIAQHAKSYLECDAVVLFLDELVLWLASHLGNREFVSDEGAKLAKLVESQDSRRAVPLVGFVARQRDLVEFLGDHVPGAERAAFGDVFDWSRGRFEDIRLEDRNLPLIAERRLLVPTGPAGKQAVDDAFAAIDRRPEVWDVLLAGGQLEGVGTGSDQEAFRRTYPFSPALVATLVALSQALQRERTALIVMQRLLVAGRDELEVNDLIPVGDLFDVLVDDEVQAVTDELKKQFETARRLYHQRFRPALLDVHRLTAEEAQGLPRGHAFRTDDRLVKTVLLAALAPDVPALAGLTAGRLAALNHGTITAWLPGEEVSVAVHTMKQLAAQVGELSVGEGDDPLVSVELTDVDHESVLERARSVDNDGNRRRALRELVWESLGISQESTIDQSQPQPVVWRGRKVLVDVVFGNVRDTHDLPDAALLAQDDRWRVVVDYPYDEEGQSPRSDLARVESLQERGVESRTAFWLPAFLSPSRVRDLGSYVVLEHVLGGTGERFLAYADHLSPVDREQARALLRQRRSLLRERLLDCLKQAYGCETAREADIDTATAGLSPVATLAPGFLPQPLVGATLGTALAHLVDQALTWSYPAHPRFEPSGDPVPLADLRKVLAACERATEDAARRTSVDAADRNALRRVCAPLEVGQLRESVFVLSEETFPWTRRFLQAAAAEGRAGSYSVRDLMRYLDQPNPRGLAPETAALVVSAFAVQQDLAWYRDGSAVDTPALDQVRPDMELRQPDLPEQEEWAAAVAAGRDVLGVHVGDLRSAANLLRLGRAVRDEAQRGAPSCRALDRLLGQHRADLGLPDDAVPDRLATAAAVTSLLDGLVVETDDRQVVTLLATASWPTTAAAARRSRETASAVETALGSANWELLRAAGRLEDERRDRADAMRDALRDAAARDELAAPLAAALAEAGRTATALLAVVVPPPPPPGVVASGRETVPAEDVERALDRVREAAEEHPGSSVTLSWEVRG